MKHLRETGEEGRRACQAEGPAQSLRADLPHCKRRVCMGSPREGSFCGTPQSPECKGFGGSVGWEEWGLSHVQVLLGQLSHLSVSGLDTAVPTTLCGNQGGTYLLALCGIRDHGEPYERQGHEASEPEVLLGSERKSLAGPAELLLPSDPCLVVAGPPIN